MTNFLRALFLLIVLSSCSNDDDEDMVCSPSPPVILVMIVDEATGDNLVQTGVYEEQDIRIINKNGDPVRFSLSTSSGGISIPLSFGSSSHVHTIALGEDLIFDIVFSLEETTGRLGCNSTSVKELQVIGMEYHEEGGQIRIIVPK